MKKQHPLCRPPKRAMGYVDPQSDDEEETTSEPIKLGVRGKWRLDDGTPGVAFIGSLHGQNFVWIAKCSCKGFECPRFKALEYVREDLGLESVIVQEQRKQ